jgi:hypothetical protein
MHDEFIKSIQYQRSIVTALFNCNAIDLKQFELINVELNHLEYEIAQQKKNTFKYKWHQFWKRKK